MKCWTVAAQNAAPKLEDQPDPVPQPGEALLQVAAVGLNFADLLMIAGTYQVRPSYPFVPGMGVSGVVLALGPDMDGPPPGSRVLAVCGAGGLAQRLCLPVAQLTPIADNLAFETAAALPIAYGTAHLALAEKARLAPGETLFVTGAAGGVGLAAVEVGKRLGAQVIALARGADRQALARAAGADLTLDSDAPDLRDRLRAAGGLDVVFDTVGGPGFDAALRATRPDGRLLAIGFASGQVPQVAANLLLVKNLSVIGFWYGGYLTHAPRLVADSLAEVLRWHAAGQLRPSQGHALPFHALPEALGLLRDRKAEGKLVIRLDRVG